MRLRIPPPEYGWVTLVWEFLIVFAGILAALVAQNWVADIIDGRKAARAQEAIAREVSLTALLMNERLAIQQCLKDRIAKLDAAITRNGPLPEPLPNGAGYEAVRQPIYRPPVRPLPDEAWQGAIATGALNHFESERVGAFGTLYSLRALWLENQQREQDRFSQLTRLNSDLALSDDTRGDLLATLAELDAYNSIMAIVSKQYVEQLGSLGLDLDLAGIEAGRKALNGQMREQRGECVEDLPLDLAPASK